MPFKSKEDELAWERDWRNRNKTKIREYKRRDYLKRRDYIRAKVRSLIALSRGKLGVSCEICGEARTIDKCHIIPRRVNGTDANWNVLYLCPTHHALFDWDRQLLSKDEWAKIENKVIEAGNRFGVQALSYLGIE